MQIYSTQNLRAVSEFSIYSKTFDMYGMRRREMHVEFWWGNLNEGGVPVKQQSLC